MRNMSVRTQAVLAAMLQCPGKWHYGFALAKERPVKLPARSTRSWLGSPAAACWRQCGNGMRRRGGRVAICAG